MTTSLLFSDDFIDCRWDSVSASTWLSMSVRHYITLWHHIWSTTASLSQTPLIRCSVCIHTQPEVSKYSGELLPLLFACLSKSSEDAGQRPRDVVRVYYAMETFCENLGMYTTRTSLLTYLRNYLTFSSQPYSVKVEKSRCSNAVKPSTLSGYFPQSKSFTFTVCRCWLNS